MCVLVELTSGLYKKDVKNTSEWSIKKEERCKLIKNVSY